MTEPAIPSSGIVVGGSDDWVLRANIKNDRPINLRPITDYMYDRFLFPQDKFDWIHLRFGYGIKTDLKPHYRRIDKKYKDLPISIELDTEIMRWADTYDLELMKEIFMIAICEGVLDVLRKYKLPTQPVENLRSQYTTIPLTIEECEERLKEKTGEAPENRYGIPDQRLQLYFEQDPEQAKQIFVQILNNTQMYEVLKKRLHLLSHHILETLIEMTLSRSSYHQEQCEELKKLLAQQKKS